jgi:hypothetical protein
MRTDTLFTIAVVLGLLVVLTMLPRSFEGFMNSQPAKTYSAGYEPRGPLDGKVSECSGLVVGNQIEGPLSVVQTGGSAFAPLANPKVDLKNNQLYDYVRNKTSTAQDVCLSSNLSTSTGCIIPTMKQVVDLDSRGGNRSMGVYI